MYNLYYCVALLTQQNASKPILQNKRQDNRTEEGERSPKVTSLPWGVNKPSGQLVFMKQNERTY